MKAEKFEEQVPLITISLEKDHDIESSSSASEARLPGPYTDEDDSNHDKCERFENPVKLRWMSRGFSIRNIRVTASNIATLLLALIPSFLRRSATPRKIHPTSWLDGLRGVAAFIVFIHHFILAWFPNLSKGYASEPNTYNFFQWPFIRIIFSGRGMVNTFFVISGYVLACSSIRKIRNREFDRLLDTLASSTFRRWIRLFMPVFAGTFVAFVISRNNGGIAPWGGPGRRGSFIEQFKDWWWSFILVSNPLQAMEPNTIFSDPYGFQLWTIPREFRGSIIIYVTLLGFAKCKQAVRLIGVALLAHYFLWMGSWDGYLFLMGLLCAELEITYKEWSTQNPHFSIFSETITPHIKKVRNIATTTVTPLLLLLSIHLLCYPDENASKTPGYLTLNTFTPSRYAHDSDPGFPQRFWLCIGAIILLFTLCFSPALSITNSISLDVQRPFTTSFAQYLGDISYALYVTHAHVIFTLGHRVKVASSKEGTESWNYIGGFCVAILVNTIGCVWAADLFWRVVDVRSVTWAKKLADWCWIK